MPRPTFLVVEPEPGHALSTRKLVLETAKFNVITAHSWQEANDLFELFPRVTAVIVTNQVDERLSCADFVRRIKQRSPDMTIIGLTPNQAMQCDQADHWASTHEPHSLVDLVRNLYGDPRPGDGAVD
jgi:DNA-binding NtrC family response regulator